MLDVALDVGTPPEQHGQMRLRPAKRVDVVV